MFSQHSSYLLESEFVMTEAATPGHQHLDRPLT